ncbi:MAG: hydroxymethylglutaryl-CoA reductase, degradative [Deltaproteobacteria bacterium]|nr:hydroxymethylglutaryl-CoA reductase, degradative [Deltaproteobacteria bacterium]
MSKWSSRIPGFYRLPVAKRRELLREHAGHDLIDDAALAALEGGGIDVETADGMIENVVGTYSLPLGIALNFLVNGRDYLVPMVIEEPSVVAAASNAARMVRQGGGFFAEADSPIMVGQVQLLSVADPDGAASRILCAKEELLALAGAATARLCERGGGPKDIVTRVVSNPGDPDGGMLVVHLEIDCRDAMGANLVNTVAEAVADRLADLAGPGTSVGLRILSNLADRRLVRVRARVPKAALVGTSGEDGARVRDGVVAASRFAELDPYRAATHNKGIMNGIDAVLLATGNDWRSVEAGAHAHAARSGRYAPIATWRAEEDDLVGVLEMPLAVGTVGGAQRVHSGARLSLALLGADSAQELACVVGAAGLSSNLAALRALATEGIQRGHMSLHARSVARAVGARGELLDRVAAEIAALGDVKPERAREILERVRNLGPACQPVFLEVSK